MLTEGLSRDAARAVPYSTIASVSKDVACLPDVS